MRGWSQNKPKNQPLYLQKELEFQREEEEKERKKREIEIQNRKDIYKRISISEIRKHAKLHDITVEDKINQLRRKRFEENKTSKSYMGHKDSIPKSLSSKYLKDVIEEERNNKILNKIKENEAQEKKNKANRFSKIVQEIYWSKERKIAEKKICKELAIRRKKRKNIGEFEEKKEHKNYIH